MRGSTAATAAEMTRGRGRRRLSLLPAFHVLGLAVLAALAVGVQPAHGVGVVGIDYGTAWIKASLMKPGLPFDVVLAKDSKRKIQAAVAWKGEDDRLFGTDAANLASRFPTDSFQATKLLLGIPCDGASEQHAASFIDRASVLHGTNVVPAPNNRAACAYQRGNANNTVYSVEELVGMQLANIKQLAEATAGERISAFSSMSSSGAYGLYGGLDVVVTVPAFYSAPERQAIYDAAGLVGMRPRLVSDGAAVAVNYALTRTFPEPERHIFYDSGAGSTRATLVEFSTRKVTPDSITTAASTPKEVTYIDVISVGWNRNAGGLALDLILRDLLIQKFEAGPSAARLQTPIRQNQRALARLLREANRVKHILSANLFAASNIEGLAEDIDFRTRVEREEFEAAVRSAADLESGFVSPIADAIKQAPRVNGFADIASVVLVGGNSRVPLVHQAITSLGGVPEAKIAQNVNADEAAVMGAAFYGASFNPQLKMKAIKARDYNPYPIVLKEPSGKPQVVFPAGPLETDAVLRQYDGVANDFVIELGYEHELPIFGSQTTRFNVTGVSSALSSIKAAGELKSVDTHLNLSIVARPIGTLGIEEAELQVQRKPGTIVDSIRSFFGGSVVAPVPTDANDTEAANITETQADRDAYLKADRTLVLNVVRLPPSGSVRDGKMAPDEYRASKDRLYTLDRAAERRAEREEARNQLESYLYRVRDLLDDDKSFEAASKPAEREAIQTKLSELQSWVSGDGDGADTAHLRLKRASLETLVKPVEKRITQASARKGAFTKFGKVQKDAETFLADARANLTIAMSKNEGSKYSASELDSLERTLSKDTKWFQEGAEAQKKRGPDDDAAINVEEVEKRAKKINDTIVKLRRRKIPKTRPKSGAKTSSSSSSAPPKPSSSESQGKKKAEEQDEKTSESGHSGGVHDEL